MKRRNMVTLTAMLLSMAAFAGSSTVPGKQDRQILELRRYMLDSAEKQQVMAAFLRDVEIPALNRLGIGPVGVFREMEGDSLTLYVLVPYDRFPDLASLPDRLAADPVYLKEGNPVLNATKQDPPYLRIESSLMEAFERLPEIVVPERKEGRIYELRQYESACFAAAQSKVEMFNAGGEIDLFLETGLNPVFFGKGIAGTKLPHLTYMISFEDMADHDARWEVFKNHPEWQRMKEIPKYKGTVSNITKTFLIALPCSQI